MNKILLLVSTSLLCTNIAFGGLAGSPYIKLAGGISKEENLKIYGTKIKSRSYGFAEVGIGYNIADNTRIDFTFNHYFIPDQKSSDEVADPYDSYTEKQLNKFETNFNTLMLNGYVDLFGAEAAKFFVGGGLGFAMTKVKITQQYEKTKNINTSTISNNGTRYTSSSNYQAGYDQGSRTFSKTGINGAYSLAAGVAAELTERVALELAYNFRGVMLSKEQEDIFNKKSINSHILVTGLRFSL